MSADFVILSVRIQRLVGLRPATCRSYRETAFFFFFLNRILFWQFLKSFYFPDYTNACFFR